MKTSNVLGRSRPALILVSLALASCQQAANKAPSVQAVSAPLNVTGGSIPIPVAPCPENDPTGAVTNATFRCDPTQRQVTWDGTYADLLAADALAQCRLQQIVNAVDLETVSEPEIGRLRDLMTSSVCPLHTANEPAGYSQLERESWDWLQQRAIPGCNAHPVTGQRAGLPLPDQSGQEIKPNASYYLPDPVLAGSGSGAREAVQVEAIAAFVHLCMAQKLSQHLDSAQVLFTSEADVLQLHEMVRDRAANAVERYALLTKGFALPYMAGITPTFQNFIPLLAEWRDWAQQQTPGSAARERFERIGEDFALAIKTLIEATEVETELAMRDAEAQSRFGLYVEGPSDPLSAASTTSTQLRGARTRVLARTYGPVSDDFDPAKQIQPAYEDPTFFQGVPALVVPSTPMSGNVYARASTVDMSAAEIPILVGLARRANAFAIVGATNRIDIDSNAATLLRAVESKVRAGDCLLRGILDAGCSVVKSDEDPEQYQVAKTLGIKPIHARTVVRALVEHIFGVPLKGDPKASELDYRPIATGDSRGLELPIDLALRVTGKHTFTGNFALKTGGRLQLDPLFGLRNLPLATQQRTWTYLPLKDLSQTTTQPATEQGFGFVALQDRLLGTVPTLVLARHVLARANTGSKPVFERATPALKLLDAAIGPRSVLIRPSVEWKTVGIETSSVVKAVPHRADGLGGLRYDNSNCMSPGCNVRWRGGRTYDIDIYRKEGDNFTINDVASVLNRTNPAATLTDPATTSTACTVGLTAMCKLPVTSNGTVQVADSELLTAQFTVVNEQSMLDLGFLANGERTGIFRGYLDVGVPRFLQLHSEHATFGRAIALGGELNEAVDEAWQMHSSDWSKPRYDGLGMSRVWNPTPDAQLHGGSSGEEAYQYFLRVADEAAGEATRALQTAYDGIEDEATDDLSINLAEERGETLSRLEMRALCGDSTSCDPYQCARGDDRRRCREEVDVDVCAGVDKEHRDRCKTFLDLITSIVGTRGFPLADPVRDQLDASAPDFAEYRGGELEGLLIEQWGAYKHLVHTVDLAGSTVATNFSSLTTAQLAHGVAILDAWKAYGDWISQLAQLGNQGYQVQALIDDSNNKVKQVESADQAAQDKQVLVCGDGPAGEFAKERESILSGVSLSVGDGHELDASQGCVVEYLWKPVAGVVSLLPDPCDSPDAEIANACGQDLCPPPPQRWHDSPTVGPPPQTVCGWGYAYRLTSYTRVNRCPGGDNFSYSSGAHTAYLDQCAMAKEDAETAATDANREIDHLEHTVIPNLQGQQMQLGLAASGLLTWGHLLGPYAHAKLAEQAIRDADTQISVSFDAQALLVQDAVLDLLRKTAAIDRAMQRAELAVARVSFDESQESQRVKSRLALSRSTGSYNLWRARALSENARKLAVAARRAIESRFVVDLSSMDASEVFVEAPSVWADEVYGSDLKPPAALGTVSGPTPSGGVYLSKVQDYVTNLELFVNGYLVQRPTASARADVDILHLPGPASVDQIVSEQGLSYSYLDPKSSGWSFYCDAVDSWISHLNAGEFDAPSYDLATACFGEPPTKARLGFWLDPWGRLYGHHMNAPYVSRHNARWSRLAVNLVGSGIRDCSKVSDAEACYAEPFIRYNLRHVGPALVTNYETQWRQLEIPIARIEAGKALTTEEWLDPVANGFNEVTVGNVARHELAGRPLGGAYELILELTPDVRIDRIDRIQLLAETDYWVRQESGSDPEREPGLASCGNGDIEEPENCDGNCRRFCPSDGNVCTREVMEGSPDLCFVECVSEPITACVGGDGCCAPGCNSINDSDCVATGCGNGVVNSNEQCDPGVPGGQTATCDNNCTFVECGDGRVNSVAGETCDGNCAESCDDGNACTNDVRTGEASFCNVACANTAITACSLISDGCCPSGCTTATDVDCSPVCGNGVIDGDETCDGASCTCNDGNACTQDVVLGGEARTCNLQCRNDEILACVNGDGCCPEGCTIANDNNCLCGNSVVNAPETCDGNCPTTCSDMDGDACTGAVLTGIASQCNVTCAPQTWCQSGDACCPAGCTNDDDNDCDLPCRSYSDTLANHEAAGRATKVCTIWSANFEQGTTTTTYFTGSSNGAVVTSFCNGSAAPNCPRAGVNSFRLTGMSGSGGTAAVWKVLNTEGLRNIRLEYWRRSYNFEAGDPVLFSMFFGNDALPAAPTTAGEVPLLPAGTATSYVQRLITNLPADPALQLRWTLMGNEATPNNDIVHLDDITVTAEGSTQTTNCQWFAVGSGTLLGSSPTARVVLRENPPGTGSWTTGGCSTIAASGSHTCALRETAGSLFCWGRNTDGQLGLNDVAQRNTPIRMTAMTGWKHVTVGGTHSCGIRTGTLPEELYCWGNDLTGQVGNGSASNADVLSPALIGANGDWSMVEAGDQHTCGIRAGELYCWGLNSSGQLGIGSIVNQSAPARVGTYADWTHVSGGTTHTCGIRSGTLWCWGNNGQGQLGDGTFSTRNAPVQIGTWADWEAISAGGFAGGGFTCGIRSGELWCWGYNTSGQLGIGTFVTQYQSPMRVGEHGDWHAIGVAGSTFSCGLRSGTLYCWGSDTTGGLGNGATLTTAQATPQQVSSVHASFQSVQMGNHVCALRDVALEEGWCWGSNTNGQLGVNDTTTRHEPTKLVFP
jgi:alpha-tubulin suppressor-like RCC1 family protein